MLPNINETLTEACRSYFHDYHGFFFQERREFWALKLARPEEKTVYDANYELTNHDKVAIREALTATVKEYESKPLLSRWYWGWRWSITNVKQYLSMLKLEEAVSSAAETNTFKPERLAPILSEIKTHTFYFSALHRTVRSVLDVCNDLLKEPSPMHTFETADISDVQEEAEETSQLTSTPAELRYLREWIIEKRAELEAYGNEPIPGLYNLIRRQGSYTKSYHAQNALGYTDIEACAAQRFESATNAINAALQAGTDAGYMGYYQRQTQKMRDNDKLLYYRSLLKQLEGCYKALMSNDVPAMKEAFSMLTRLVREGMALALEPQPKTFLGIPYSRWKTNTIWTLYRKLPEEIVWVEANTKACYNTLSPWLNAWFNEIRIVNSGSNLSELTLENSPALQSAVWLMQITRAYQLDTEKPSGDNTMLRADGYYLKQLHRVALYGSTLMTSQEDASIKQDVETYLGQAQTLHLEPLSIEPIDNLLLGIDELRTKYQAYYLVEYKTQKYQVRLDRPLMHRDVRKMVCFFPDDLSRLSEAREQLESAYQTLISRKQALTKRIKQANGNEALLFTELAQLKAIALKQQDAVNAHYQACEDACVMLVDGNDKTQCSAYRQFYPDGDITAFTQGDLKERYRKCMGKNKKFMNTSDSSKEIATTINEYHYYLRLINGWVEPTEAEQARASKYLHPEVRQAQAETRAELDALKEAMEKNAVQAKALREADQKEQEEQREAQQKKWDEKREADRKEQEEQREAQQKKWDEKREADRKEREKELEAQQKKWDEEREADRKEREEQREVDRNALNAKVEKNNAEIQEMRALLSTLGVKTPLSIVVENKGIQDSHTNRSPVNQASKVSSFFQPGTEKTQGHDVHVVKNSPNDLVSHEIDSLIESQRYMHMT